MHPTLFLAPVFTLEINVYFSSCMIYIVNEMEACSFGRGHLFLFEQLARFCLFLSDTAGILPFPFSGVYDDPS